MRCLKRGERSRAEFALNDGLLDAVEDSSSSGSVDRNAVRTLGRRVRDSFKGFPRCPGER